MKISNEERRARKNAARNLKYANDPEYAQKEKDKAAAYRLAKPALASAAKERWRTANRDKDLAGKREHYQKNREAALAKMKSMRLANLDDHLVRERAFRRKHRVRLSAASSARQKANPEQSRVRGHNYRARSKAAEGTLSRDIYQRLMVLQKNKCACCKVDLRKVIPNLDHIVSLFKGGSNTDSNVQLLCKSCNCSKSAKDPVEFMRERGFLI